MKAQIRRYLATRKAHGTYSEASVRSIGSRLRSFADHYGPGPIEAVGWRDVDRWLTSLADRTAATRASYLTALRRFFRWMIREGLAVENPAADIDPIPKPRTVPRAMSPEAVAALFRACRTPRERLIVWLMVGLGLRRKEVAGLRWEHYDQSAGVLLVAQGKGGHQRLLPVPEGVAAALKAVGPKRGGPVITGKAGPHRPVTPGTVGTIVRERLKAAGLKLAPFDGVSGHALRHTCASDVLDRCGDLRVVQEMLGHINLATTSIYLRRAAMEQMREAMEGRSYDEAA